MSCFLGEISVFRWFQWYFGSPFGMFNAVRAQPGSGHSRWCQSPHHRCDRRRYPPPAVRLITGIPAGDQCDILYMNVIYIYRYYYIYIYIICTLSFYIPRKRGSAKYHQVLARIWKSCVYIYDYYIYIWYMIIYYYILLYIIIYDYIWLYMIICETNIIYV